MLKPQTTTRRISITNIADEFWVGQSESDEDAPADRWCQVRVATDTEVTVAIYERGKEMEVRTITYSDFFEQFKQGFFPEY